MLLGGTLTQLAGSLGTPYAFNPPDGHVLFLDEVGERPYRIVRLFTQLAQAGIIRRDEDGYMLTKEGQSLTSSLDGLNSWAVRWAKRTRPLNDV